jgi:hypothetical protein
MPHIFSIPQRFLQLAETWKKSSRSRQRSIGKADSPHPSGKLPDLWKSPHHRYPPPGRDSVQQEAGSPANEGKWYCIQNQEKV